MRLRPFILLKDTPAELQDVRGSWILQYSEFKVRFNVVCTLLRDVKSAGRPSNAVKCAPRLRSKHQALHRQEIKDTFGSTVSKLLWGKKGRRSRSGSGSGAVDHDDAQPAARAACGGGCLVLTGPVGQSPHTRLVQQQPPGPAAARKHQRGAEGWQPCKSASEGLWLAPGGEWAVAAAPPALPAGRPPALQLLDLRLQGRGSSSASVSTSGSGSSSVNGVTIQLPEHVSVSPSAGVFVADGGEAVLVVQQRGSSSSSGGGSAEPTQWHLWVSDSSIDHLAGGKWTRLPDAPGADHQRQRHAAAHATVFTNTAVSGLWVTCAAAAARPDGSMILSVLRQPALPPVPGASSADGSSASGAPQQPAEWSTLQIQAVRQSGGQADDEASQSPEHPGLTRRIELVLPPAEGPRAGDRPAALSPDGAVLAWHPDGSLLAVGVAAEDGAGCWILLLTPDLRLLHECCWHAAVGRPPQGLINPERYGIASLCWLGGVESTLGAVDSHGRVALLRYTGDAATSGLERLQVMDAAGLTVTPKPSLWLPTSMLAATACGGIHPSQAPARFMLAVLPPGSSPASGFSSSSGGGGGGGGSCTSTISPSANQARHAAAAAACRLAIWDGQDVVVCDCFPGCNPSRQSIDDSISPKVQSVFFNRISHAGAADGGDRSSGGAAAATAAAAHGEGGAAAEAGDGAVVVRLLLQKGAGGQVVAGGEAEAADGGGAAAGSMGIEHIHVELLVNPATTTAAADAGAAVERSADEGEPPAEVKAAGPEEEQLAAVWSQLSTADADFLQGRWDACTAAYKQLLPLSCGHLFSVRPPLLICAAALF
jgi:hypothetical protein